MITTALSERRAAYENYDTPESVPEFELVPLKAPSGDHQTDYREVAGEDHQEVSRSSGPARMSSVGVRQGLLHAGNRPSKRSPTKGTQGRSGRLPQLGGIPGKCAAAKFVRSSSGVG